MTEDNKIYVLRKMIEDEEIEDEVLSIYLDLAAQKILNRMYPYKTCYDGLTVPERYTAVQLKCAGYMIAKIGAEGQIQHIENGIHRNWGSADIPDVMLADVVPFCQAIR